MSAIALGGRLAASIFGSGGGLAAGALAGKAMAGAFGGGLAAAGGAPGAGRVLDFRRRGAPPRRRRRSPLLALGKPLGIAAATVGLPLALAAWLLTSSQFQLRSIVVVGPPGARAAGAPAAAAPAASARAASRPAASAPTAPVPALSIPSASAPLSPPSAPAATAPSASPAPSASAVSAPAASAPRVPVAWVRQALAPLVGRNLLRLRLAEVRLRLAANPWIAAVEAAKELPDRLRVTVAERRPEVLLRLGEALLYADAAGRPIAPVGPPEAGAAAAAARQGLLVVSLPPLLAGPRPPAAAAGAGDSMISGVAGGLSAGGVAGVAGALRLAAQLRLLRPEWKSSLSQIDVIDEDDFQLHVAGLPCPLLVRGSRLADNLVRFEQLLPELRRRYPALAAVDLRYSRRIVVQPAAAATAAAKTSGKAAATAIAAPAAIAVSTAIAAPTAKTAVKPAPPSAAAAAGRSSENF